MTEDQLYNSVINIINQAIGSRLATFGKGANAKPAIFKKSAANQAGQPLHGVLPYCVVVMGTRTSNGANHHARWYNADGEQVKQVLRDVQCTIQVVGGDAADMCSDLENFLIFSDYSIDYLCSLNLAVRRSVLGVVNDTTIIANQSRDSAFIIVTLTTHDEVVEQVYDMNIVDATLNLRHSDSEENIVSTNINIP